jgi:hypothetical protein
MNSAIKFLFLVTMAISGFLLFQLQPMIARFILPWFGGSATTWTACMLFFQAGLLLGYTYAHLAIRPFPPKAQVAIHLMLISGAIATLPITPSDIWKPNAIENPTGYIFLLLSGCTALPYAVLSATSPLLQNWLTILGAKTPSRFFAMSNFGSLLGLLSYPFFVDPLLPTTTQTLVWSWGFALFAVLMAGCGLAILLGVPLETLAIGIKRPHVEDRPKFAKINNWFALSALGSMLLLATTNEITSHVPVNPFLWVIPLSIYLLSFVIVFARPAAYRPNVYVPAFAIAVIVAFALPLVLNDSHSLLRIAAELLPFGLGCMICHGELSNRQPQSQDLTLYYLVMALGGAAGGVSVSLIAPQLFADYWEYPATIIAVGLIGVVSITFPPFSKTAYTHRMLRPLTALVLIFSFGMIAYSVIMESEDVIAQSRNFYGVIKVHEEEPDSPTDHLLIMTQSGENQGEQYTDEKLRDKPACDFAADSGLGLALDYLTLRNPSVGRKLGVVGLGVGITAALSNANDTVRYYELNPAVTDFANKYFFYLKDSAAKIDVVHGDGRLTLERELVSGSQQYDLLHVDAFRGNAPPVHLMTKEAFEIYLGHLRNDGFLVVTSHPGYLNSSSLFRGLAKELGLKVRWFSSPNDCESDVGFAVFTRDGKFFLQENVGKRISQWPDNSSRTVLWTDQSSSLMSLMVWR